MRHLCIGALYARAANLESDHHVKDDNYSSLTFIQQVKSDFFRFTNREHELALKQYEEAKARGEKPKKPKKQPQSVAAQVRYYCKHSGMKPLSGAPGFEKYKGSNAIAQRFNVANALDSEIMEWLLEQISAGEEPTASLPQVIYIPLIFFRESVFFYFIFFLSVLSHDFKIY